MNRVWNVWCSLSGTDSSDARLKMAFNVDPRVASLSGLSVELVEAVAFQLWHVAPARSPDEFLDPWLAAVTEQQRRADDAVEHRRRQRARGEVRRLKAEEERRQRQVEQAASLRRASDEQRLELENRSAALVRSRIQHLFNITSVGNVASIADRGILCHDRAASLDHDDLSDGGVQSIREGRIVAGGANLHQFASLYLNPRNAMLFRLVREGHDVVVLRISHEVLDDPGVVVTDGNAASGESRSWQGVRGLAQISLDRIYSREWTVDGVVDEDLRRTKQAEILVPHVVQARHILGFLAPSQAIYERTIRAAPRWSGKVDRDLFFDS